ncbi:MAG: hypothetical protein KatS3mg082_1066 [Nitrospiraceae bacterium]|nr:MAG: hypothetical protein KatS3mg082_1066 [Nitrospiraceae bacterium]
MNGTKTSPLTILSASVFAVGVVTLEMFLSPSWSWFVLYVIPVAWIALWSSPDDVVLVSTASMIVTGFDLLPCLLQEEGWSTCGSMANRLIVAGTIWLIALLSLARKKTQRTFKWINLSRKR